MRQEDKEVDGPDLERAEERKRENELVEEKEDEVHDLDGLPETTLDGERSTTVTAAMRAILEGDQLVVNDLKLPKRQITALEALKAAVEGKDTQLSRFVYAEDRRALLEQALAVLQPELASMQGAGAQFENLIARVGELRERLNVLEDSEESFLESQTNIVEDNSDTDDKDDDDDLDDPKKPTKPKKKPAKATTTDKTENDTSLDGPERPVPPKGPTTLAGPERPVAPKETTLEGPDRPVAPSGPTTLGDEAEIAESARSEPRWRRSGG